jgi:hypothetical protein
MKLLCKKRKPEDALSVVSSSTPKRRLTTPDGIPTFEAVLTGEVVLEPWAPKTFLDFLHAEHNDENFFFFQETEAFRALEGKVPKAPSDDLLLLPGDVRADLPRYVHEIIETFVRENAPRQVNISATQREKLLNDVKAALEAQGYDADVFEEAQNEVKRLMQLDAWPRFKQKMLTHNLSPVGVEIRLYKGLLGLALVILTVAVMLVMHVPRWYIFLLFIPCYPSFEGILSYSLGFCPGLARKGLINRFTGSSSVPIACPIVKGRTRQMLVRFTFFNVLAALALTLFLFALTYIIEAGTGQTLYT